MQSELASRLANQYHVGRKYCNEMRSMRPGFKHRWLFLDQKIRDSSLRSGIRS